MSPFTIARRAAFASLLAVMLSAAGCASMQPSTRKMSWTGVTHAVSFDPATGKFVRQGVAMFSDGDLALQVVEGTFTARDGSAFAVKLTYRFEDGSTLVHEGNGQTFMDGDKRVTKGEGTITGGTGRFAGISGTTTSTARSLTMAPNEQVAQYTAEYTLPRK